ncbi:MAG: 2-hydroxy-3-oxopropionate reductase [Nitrospinae bacterium]|nr:2-hydroxy-3-oxopropionate reductase [Nitrospinota bacterium]
MEEKLEKIGFIGLGIMGKPMARNLMKAGYSLVVYNRSPKPVEELVKEDAVKANSAAEVAEEAKIIITMLPDGPDVEQVILGPKGIIDKAKSGSIVIDMSSIAPAVTLHIGEVLHGKGIHFIDAPVSGGEPGAIAGTLSIMVGGDEGIVEEVKPILQKMGKSVIRVGELGAGQTAKLVNQILVAIHIQAMGEAFVLAKKSGVSPTIVFEAIRNGLAGSNILNAKMPLILSRNFKPGFKMKLHQKDLRNALLTARELGLNLPVTTMVQKSLSSLVEKGKGEEDHSGLVHVIEEINNITISK